MLGERFAEFTRTLRSFFENAGGMVHLLFDTVFWTFVAPFRRKTEHRRLAFPLMEPPIVHLMPKLVLANDTVLARLARLTNGGPPQMVPKLVAAQKVANVVPVQVEHLLQTCLVLPELDELRSGTRYVASVHPAREHRRVQRTGTRSDDSDDIHVPRPQDFEGAGFEGALRYGAGQDHGDVRHPHGPTVFAGAGRSKRIAPSVRSFRVEKQ